MAVGFANDYTQRFLVVDPIEAQQKPAAKLLVDRVVPVAHGRLSDLDQKGLCIPIDDLAQSGARLNLTAKGGRVHPESLAGDLHEHFHG